MPNALAILLHKYLLIHIRYHFIQKTGKYNQSNCPPTDESIMKMWLVYKMEFFETLKKKSEIMKFSGNGWNWNILF